jgi:pyruvate kinase
VVLEVVRHAGQGIYGCLVTGDGVLRPRKAVTAPGVELGLGALNPENQVDLMLAAELGLEYVLLSFVRTAGEVKACRSILPSAVRIVAKIETAEAVAHLASIVAEADAVMVARGDLALQCGYERLALLQWNIAEAAHAAGKPFIVATQVFESVIDRMIPSRADLLDLSHAVALGAAAVMLGPETCMNPEHVRAIETAQRVLTTIKAAGVTLRLTWQEA